MNVHDSSCISLEISPTNATDATVTTGSLTRSGILAVFQPGHIGASDTSTTGAAGSAADPAACGACGACGAGRIRGISTYQY